MDSWFPFTTLALLLPIILFFLRNRKNSRPVSVKWPPGPKTLPIIGNIHQISGLPFRSLTDLAKQYGPLMRLKLGQVETIVVSSPELARQILKESGLSYADRPGSIAMKTLWYDYRNIAFSPYGDYYIQMRKICVTELLSPKSVRSFGSIRREEVSRLIDSIRLSAASGEPLDVTYSIFSTMSSVTCRATFGEVCKDKDTLIKMFNDGIRLAGGFEIADFFPSSAIINALSLTRLRLVRMRRKLDLILDDWIDQHRVNRANCKSGNEDLVDVMLRLEEAGGLQFPLRNDNIKAVINVSSIQIEKILYKTI